MDQARSDLATAINQNRLIAKERQKDKLPLFNLSLISEDTSLKEDGDDDLLWSAFQKILRENMPSEDYAPQYAPQDAPPAQTKPPVLIHVTNENANDVAPAPRAD